jgi:hypothetical protein
VPEGIILPVAASAVEVGIEEVAPIDVPWATFDDDGVLVAAGPPPKRSQAITGSARKIITIASFSRASIVPHLINNSAYIRATIIPVTMAGT